MQARNSSVLMIGLLVLGFLIAPYTLPWEPVEAQAQLPVIQFVSPPAGDEPRYTRTGDPINPVITVDVEVTFPIVETPCAGVNPPVDTSTLEVYVWRVIDADMQQEWPVDTSSGWTWTGDPDRVEGQVTIGGLGSGQDRSRYCVRVCIENALGKNCQRGGYLRAEFPVAGFTTRFYNVRGTSFSQGGATCNLIPSIAFSLINQEMAARVFTAWVPSGAEIGSQTGYAVDFYDIPLINSISMTASLDETANNVLLEETEVSEIALPVINIPGLSTNCVISGFADGSLLGEVSPGLDLDGSIRVYGIELDPGPPELGTCDLVADPTCELNVKFDGYP